MAKITLEFGRTPDGRIGFKGLAEFTGDAGVDAVTSQVTQDVESMLISMGVERNADTLNITEKE
ncbi:hypothetical protein C9J12_18200 [Photobacterium frigidiphilum]|uniref:Uncharacterized protein n=1 Tax=Photobacterium frigidiphilum TaxID=264736 RepID=A0A2T3JCR4_9GAMM|nr:hypothetical protein [Photobacterium frigidiphilum]PSU46642.1 hypothetical protein C9J12_18200 [Photobacterium frigidiphilum]